MRQGTTPAYVLTVKNQDLRDKTVYVTLKDKNNHLVTKSGEDVTVTYSENDSVIAFRLSQKETFALNVGAVKIQVRFIDANGIAKATNKAEVDNLDVLLNKIIRYEGEG